MASNYSYFWIRFWSVLESVSFIFNFLLSSRGCDHMDSGSAREELPENVWCKVMGGSNVGPRRWHLRFSWKLLWICENQILKNLGEKINLRIVSGIKIHPGPALRAILKISAEPDARPMGGDCSWRCRGNLVLNLQFECVNQLRWDSILFNMARGNGLVYGRRQFGPIMASNYSYFSRESSQKIFGSMLGRDSNFGTWWWHLTFSKKDTKFVKLRN